MQCLTHTPPLVAFALDNEHLKFKAAGFSALYAVGEHIREALLGGAKSLAPLAVVKNLRHIARSFRVGRQEDAHEFSRYLLEAMQAACVGARKLPAGVAETSFVARVFGGRLRSQIKCACGRASNTYDPFLDLSLEIARAGSVDKALKRFCAVEVLDGDNAYRCEHTRRLVRATKALSIDKAPAVLALQLKRFQFGAFGGKINAPVAFGPLLDLAPFMSTPPRPGDSCRYALYGVLVHAGRSTHSGHYTAFVRAAAGTWHCCDDERVRHVSEAAVLAQHAYMLFYVRLPAGGAGPALPMALARAPAGAREAESEEEDAGEAVPRKRRALLASPPPLPPLRTAGRAGAEAAGGSPRRLRSGRAGAASPSPRGTGVLHRDARQAGMAHLRARRAAMQRARTRRALHPASPPAAPPAAKAAPAVAAKPAAPAVKAARPARPAAGDDDAGDAAALAAQLAFPRKWGQFASDSVARWDGADAETAARADALVKAQRPAFRRARDRDSYDEDYDRGRTKKVRLRGPLAFGDDGDEGGGGLNPFTSRQQQMAHGRPKDGAKRGAGRMRRDADAEAKGVKPGRGGGRGGGGRGRGGRGGGGGRGRR
jgi:ubiquitin carboxyl-terminal hydrolase 36/42